MTIEYLPNHKTEVYMVKKNSTNVIEVHSFILKTPINHLIFVSIKIPIFFVLIRKDVTFFWKYALSMIYFLLKKKS